jgi:hypothetical protein
MTTNTLTQERLKEVLNYCPESGVFVWIGKTAGQRKFGNVAGTTSVSGYRDIKVDGTLFRAHRLAWLYVYGEFPPDQIDHINREKADNRLVNLRAVTQSENQHNSNLKITNKSGFKGVCYHKNNKKWCAQIRLNSVSKNLGYFASPEAAGAAYLAAQKIYHPTCPAM